MPKLFCVCGLEVSLKRIGDHLDSWVGQCCCSRVWSVSTHLVDAYDALMSEFTSATPPGVTIS